MRHGGSAHKRVKRHAGALIGATALLTLAPAQAPVAASAAANQPAASTGGATAVSFGSATLNGSLNPKGSDTSYYFQYGATKLYGLQTGILDAGAGTHALHVSVAIGGLQPLTVYHYRLVAVNASGPAIGADRSLLTTKVPLSLAIFASPNLTSYGGPVTIQGTLSGTDNAGREVVLQANPFPYAAGFANIGNPELTNASGSFSFALLSLSQTTQFRVVTTTKSPVVSPVALEGVAVRVSAHAGRIGRRHRARFFGTVTPAVDGMKIGIMRIVHGHDVLVGGAVLKHATATSSRFSKLVRATRGEYRVFVQVTNGALTSTFSAPFFVR
jgi:hypothetical protein